MTGMAVLLLFDQLSAIVTALHSVMTAVTGGARMEDIKTERETIKVRNAGFLLGHHLGSGRSRYQACDLRPLAEKIAAQSAKDNAAVSFSSQQLGNP